MQLPVHIKNIEPGDNKPLAAVIRNALAEFGANKPGTVYYDETTDHLYDVFKQPGSFYYVAYAGNVLNGGAGLYPTADLPAGYAELVKMYLAKQARGQGLGRLLINKVLENAAAMGYTHVYLETMPELKQALKVYEKFGFEYLTGPLGNSGHFGCDVWMLKKL
jgi:putative acetyltransferase